MTLFLYLEINLFALAIVLLLFISRKQSHSLPLDEKLFDYLLVAIMLALVFDSGMWLIDGRQFLYARELNLLITTCYYLASVLVCYAWVLYCDYKLFEDEQRLHKRMLLYNIPMMFCVVMALTSPFTGAVFTVDELNVYQRGAWFWPVSLLSLSYLGIGGALSVIRARTAETRAEKRECLVLALYMVAPLAGALLQAFFYGLSLVWVCTVVSAVMLYVYVQSQQISTDALTGINNRRRFDKFLDWKLQSADSSGRLYVIMLDVDDFKSINDSYGHSMGDSALVRVAELLKRCCSRGDFLARIGGDEFAMICQRDSKAELQSTIAAIEDGLRAFNTARQAPYTLSISTGYALYNAKTCRGQDALVSEADARMYEAKAAHKRAGAHS